MKYVFLGVMLLATVVTATARADAVEDFQAGMKLYQEGNLIEAMTSLKKSADAGHASAQAAYAYLLDKSDYDLEAVRYYQQSADQGHPDGMVGLAGMYAGGEGVVLDNAAARKWYLMAAEKGQPMAIRVLAEAYARGGLGLTETERNSEDAARWIRKSADDGYIPIMKHLLGLYEKGGNGIKADPAEAEKLRKRIAEAMGTQGGAPEKGKRRRFFQ